MALINDADRRNPPMDEAAFSAFYNRTAAGLRAYLRQLCGQPSLADDLLQEAFLRFLRGRNKPPDERQWKPYLYRIATNLYYDHWRHLQTERKWEGGAPPVSPRADDPAIQSDVKRLFGRLKPKERAVLWLAYVEGSEHREIAETLAVNEKSVRVMLFRARGKLADLLRRHGLAPEGKR